MRSVVRTVGISLCALAASACGGPGPALLPAPAVEGFRADGDFTEWAASPLRAGNGRDLAGPDLTGVKAAADPEVLHLLLDFARPVNLQSMAATVRVALDGDGDASTGERIAALAGADLVLDLSAMTPGAPMGAGMRLRFAGDTTVRSVYDVGFAYAPTHSSARFEVDVQRVAGGREILPGRVLRGLLVMLDAAGAPQEVLGPFGVEAPPARAAQPPRAVVNLERPRRTAMRVLSWNVGDDGILRGPDPFRRLLRAADPDVVLLDELSPRITAGHLRSLLPGGDWSIVLGAGGGRQRTAVASRLPLRAAARMERVAWPDSVAALAGLPMPPQVRQDLEGGPIDDLPTVGAIVSLGGVRVLFAAIDLSCCGHAGSAEDRARVIAASAVNAAARDVLQAGAADAVVIGGDLNLVGSRRPLEVLAHALDPRTGDLVTAEVTTPDGRTYSTWRAPGPFPPGRLDWVLYSGSTFEQVGGLVLDAARFTPETRSAAGLEPMDSEVTDHLPVVVDLAVRPAAPTPAGRVPSKP